MLARDAFVIKHLLDRLCSCILRRRVVGPVSRKPASSGTGFSRQRRRVRTSVEETRRQLAVQRLALSELTKTLKSMMPLEIDRL